MSETGIIEIHGRQYHTVAKRIADFREKHPDYSITTKILSAADLIQIKATIKDTTGFVLATGTAEEERGSTNINKTSALENCETSAIGRCLGVFGMGGQAIASAEEMQWALDKQQQIAESERLINHNAAVREHIDSIVAIKTYLLNEDYSAAYEAIAEIPQEDAKTLWIAPSRGGIWTTREREQMKSNEWAQARKDHHNGEAE